MREIKFRAWSIKDNSYINGCNMYGFVLGQGAPEEMLERYDSKWKKGEFLLEQFTGLKDKNGKDIYEGDIAISGMGTEQIYRDVCEYDEERCMFMWVSLPDRDIQEYLDEYAVEIIGNIHEKPELLEENNGR